MTNIKDEKRRQRCNPTCQAESQQVILAVKDNLSKSPNFLKPYEKLQVSGTPWV